jgi:hypothetical protein
MADLRKQMKEDPAKFQNGQQEEAQRVPKRSRKRVERLTVLVRFTGGGQA